MWKYLAKRLLQIPPVLFIVTIMIFVLVYIAGDPVATMLPADASPEEIAQFRHALGFDEPFYVQFGNYILDLLRGDFGESYQYGTSALGLVLERLPATLELATASMIIAILIAIPLGILSAVKPNTFIDFFATSFSVLGKAIPNFWLGIMLILVFSVTLKVLPVSGTGSYAHIVLPAITLGTAMSAEITRLVRSSMLEILHQDYIRTARSKGLKYSAVVIKHAFKNSLVPVITITFLQAAALVGGSLITEMIFAWPGLGQLIIQAVYAKDLPIIQAAVFVTASMIIFINILTDIMYRVLDPRIKFN
ncbi:peptide/nickel transport system permease protein [Psychrobacillus sp. OK028]|uniref:ABC transporter permease n=1 Tax=Psychrobacillus sp. OK028 TaxID=1884359 RepID=UPI0008868B64|nr:ABC transporter permease [Psychrobacillus sp. OK028]SDN29036.1 peptide/nickel transport system permease protein [Psychrobacillus sp. OK028]